MSNNTRKINDSYADNEDVHELVDVSAFERRLSAVHHQLRVFTGEYHETEAPAGVTQNTAAQQQLVVVKGELLIPPI